MEITKEQYLAALEIVEGYHKQIGIDSRIATGIQPAILRDEELSTRAYTVLRSVAFDLPNYNETVYRSGKSTIVDYLDMGLTKYLLERQRNCGKTTVLEIERVLSKYNQKLPIK